MPLTNRTRRAAGLFLVVVALVAAGCATEAAPPPEKDYGRPLPPGARALELVTDRAQYPDFRAMFGDRESLLRALDNSLDYFSKPSSRRYYPFQEFTHERVVASLETLKTVLLRAESPEELSGFVTLFFDVYRSVGWDGSGEVLFTAYYQPIFDGSRERTERFSTPLYALPGDLVKDEDGTPLGRRDGDRIVPYFTRREIETQDVFAGQGLELAWVETPLDAFIIHVQGSARIRLPDGEMMYIGYAGKTDHEYTSIGEELIADGRIDEDELSLAAIRSHFAAHPDEVRDYLHRNDCFVFFTETGPGGPWGSLGAPVTAYRTIATDKAVFPRGAPCAVETKVPVAAGGRLRAEPFTSFVVDQDTGGAIRSAGRCDLFVGTGEAAEQIAGHTKYEGRLFYLFVKEDRPLANR